MSRAFSSEPLPGLRVHIPADEGCLYVTNAKGDQIMLSPDDAWILARHLLAVVAAYRKQSEDSK